MRNGSDPERRDGFIIHVPESGPDYGSDDNIQIRSDAENRQEFNQRSRPGSPFSLIFGARLLFA